MLRVGLTGGLATGKSFVGEILVELGCRLFKADDAGRAAIAPGGEAAEAVAREFGTTDRAELAARVFADAGALARLNAIVHPAVRARQAAWMAGLPRDAIAVVEAAILIETGSAKSFDAIVLTVCDPEVQFARAMSRPGAREDDVRARLARQMPQDRKRAHADYIIDTTGTFEDTRAQTLRVFASLDSQRGRHEG
jgi:dephospho-CoA kinase